LRRRDRCRERKALNGEDVAVVGNWKEVGLIREREKKKEELRVWYV